MNKHEKINYVEFPAKDLLATKDFFARAFGWSFQDFGPDYTAFAAQGLDGGFFKSNLASTTKNSAALIVFYSRDLEATLDKVQGAGARSRRPYSPFRVGVVFIFANRVGTSSRSGPI